MMERVRSLFSPRREPVNSKQINCRRPTTTNQASRFVASICTDYFYRVHRVYTYIPGGFSKGNRANRFRGGEKRGKSIARWNPRFNRGGRLTSGWTLENGKSEFTIRSSIENKNRGSRNRSAEMLSRVGNVDEALQRNSMRNLKKKKKWNSHFDPFRIENRYPGTTLRFFISCYLILNCDKNRIG